MGRKSSADPFAMDTGMMMDMKKAAERDPILPFAMWKTIQQKQNMRDHKDNSDHKWMHGQKHDHKGKTGSEIRRFYNRKPDTKETNRYSLALIDVGGGMRGMYAAGVLDGLLQENIRADLCIGVSAGSGNLASYCAGQQGRNKPFYDTYPQRDAYLSLHNLKTKKTLFDFDYIYGDLTNADGENPLDLQAMKDGGQKLLVVATNALSGRPVYFDASRVEPDHFDIFKASCAIPVLCHPYKVKGIPFVDGTLSDPVPLKKALEEGADKIVLILSKPLQAHPVSTYSPAFVRMLENTEFGRRYPKAAKTLLARRQLYNDTVALAQKLEQEHRLLLLYPDDLCGVGPLSKHAKGMEALYQKGVKDAAKVQAFLQGSPAQLHQGSPKYKS